MTLRTSRTGPDRDGTSADRPRLRIAPEKRPSAGVDGAWWPRSDDLVTELTELRHVITTKLPRVVVDLRRITAMESAGLDVLADAHELAVQHGGWLRASGAGQWLADLTRASGSGRPLDHYATLADALPSYRRAASGLTSRR